MIFLLEGEKKSFCTKKSVLHKSWYRQKYFIFFAVFFISKVLPRFFALYHMGLGAKSSYKFFLMYSMYISPRSHFKKKDKMGGSCAT